MGRLWQSAGRLYNTMDHCYGRDDVMSGLAAVAAAAAALGFFFSLI